jgi:hypothetical protein
VYVWQSGRSVNVRQRRTYNVHKNQQSTVTLCITCSTK